MPRLSLDDDPLRTRIHVAVSPTAELLNSLHVLANPSHHPSNQAWAARVLAEMAPDLRAEVDSIGTHFDEWLGISDLIEHVPALEAPVPAFLEAIAALPPELVVRTALGIADEAEIAPPNDPAQHATLDHPAAFHQRLITVLRRYWEEGFAVEWQRRAPVLEQRRAHEAARLDHLDPAVWLASLHDRIGWNGAAGELIFHKGRDYRFRLAGMERITCLPSTFSAPHLMVGFTARTLTIFINTPYSAPAPERVPAGLLEVARALGDETRLRIYKLTLRRPHYTQELAAALGLAEPTVSRHLKLLRAAGLVRSEKSGGVVLYTGLLDAVDRLPAVLREYIRG